MVWRSLAQPGDQRRCRDSGQSQQSQVERSVPWPPARGHRGEQEREWRSDKREPDDAPFAPHVTLDNRAYVYRWGRDLRI
jgi:hypothetical protein